MNGSHQTLNDAELVVQNLGDGSETVGGAGSVRNELLAGVCVLVDTNYEHGSSVLGGSRHNNILGTCLDVSLSLLLSQEQTCGLYNVLSTYSTPVDLLRVAACGNADVLAVYDQLVLLHVSLYGAIETSVHRVVLQHIGHVVYREKVVDCHYFEVIALCAGAEYETADTTESVNTNLCHCLVYLKFGLICILFIFGF